MEQYCTLTNEELIARCDKWIHKLAESGGKEWVLSVPVDFDRDPDMLFTELCNRLKAATQPPSLTEQAFQLGSISGPGVSVLPPSAPAVDQPKLTPEGISKRKDAIDWYRNPAASTVEGQYNGSVFRTPGDGVLLGCISPEARDLLDTIMERWEEHYKDLKKTAGEDHEPTFYGFAYWLCRWSGLIQPAGAASTIQGAVSIDVLEKMLEATKENLEEKIIENMRLKEQIKDGSQRQQAGAVWVKGLPKQNGFYAVKHTGGGYGGCGFKDGKWNQSIADQKIVAYLDETTPKESDAEAFGEWLRENYESSVDGINWVSNSSNAKATTAQLYQVFKSK